MTQNILVLLETSGIQEYIFGSNHLAQNIGASELVYRSTTQWVEIVLKKLGFSHNIERWDEATGLILNSQRLGSVDVEVVYAGGGNTMLLFTSDEKAADFIHALTGRVLKKARGLQLIAGRMPFTEDDQAKSLRLVHEKLRGKLAQRKLNRTVSTPLLGLGVTAACVYTNLPAIGNDHDEEIVGKDYANKMAETNAVPQLISASVAHKLRAEKLGKRRLEAVLKNQRMAGLEFVYDFDHFGSKGESSYIAVVHADANKMGDRFKQLSNTTANDQDYIEAIRQLSDSVKLNARKALGATVGYLLAAKDPIEPIFGGGRKKVEAPLKNGRRYLPFRPIVFGGDDTTFICDGRLGLPLAAKYLQEFTKDNLSDGKPVFARAGVAVVKTHFPFSRAYELSEKLAGNAKKHIEELQLANEDSATVMDWHFSTTGVIRELDEIRQLEYRVNDSSYQKAERPSVLSRPIRVAGGAHSGQWRNWDVFTNLVDAFQNNDLWSGRRNKVIAMRNALRGGPKSKSFELFRENYRIEELPPIPGRPNMQLTGWDQHECGYFDAIEAIDFFVSLELEKEEA